MKRYQSHKVVEAAPMLVAAFRADGSGNVGIDDGKGGVEYIDVPAGFKRPNTEPSMNPDGGDYLVRYQPDGYLSWSPRAVFEAGYTPVVDKPATWQERAVLELNALATDLAALRAALLAGPNVDAYTLGLMQAQYKGMEAYHANLELRLRYLGVIDTETPPTVRETPAAPDEFPHTAETSRNWMDTAAQHLRNEEYYRGLVEQVGDALGEAAYMDDKGELHDAVLCAKVPLLVREAMARRRRPMGDEATARETPATVEVTVTAPAGKRAMVTFDSGSAPLQRWTVAEGQSQTWSVLPGEGIGITAAATSTVAHKRPAG